MVQCPCQLDVVVALVAGLVVLLDSALGPELGLAGCCWPRSAGLVGCCSGRPCPVKNPDSDLSVLFGGCLF